VWRLRVVETVGSRQKEGRGELREGGADYRVIVIAKVRKQQNERRERFRHVVVVRDVSIRRIERKRAQLDL
jgi:hypothetical protein